jgi:hypothetical protein
VRRCLFFASYEARPPHGTGSQSKHLLLAILRHDPSLVPAPAIEAVRRAIEAKDPRPTPLSRCRLRTRAILLSTETDRVVPAARKLPKPAADARFAPRDLAAEILRDPNMFARG